jgi:hypothetical protein
MEIVKIIKSMPTNIINSCKKIYGTCRHQNKFHWLNSQSQTSTDEGGTQKKVKASGFHIANKKVLKLQPNSNQQMCKSGQTCHTSVKHCAVITKYSGGLKTIFNGKKPFFRQKASSSFHL